MNKEHEILEYIHSNFNVDRISMLLMGNIFDYLYDTTEDYLEDFIKIVNDSGIDITIEELKENNVIE